jgi:triacylglycerol lipase
MGLFTAFQESVYPGMPPGTLVAPGFSIDTAKTLAWAAQLAYETASANKFRRILSAWGWHFESIITGVFTSTFPFSTTNGFIATVGNTTIIAFAGTEPESVLQWIRNFSIEPSQSVHAGFKAGVEAVWPQLTNVIDAANEIYFTGHSLGGALSVVAVDRIRQEKPGAIAMVRGVYTIGMPRVGIEGFSQTYNATLGERTFRLVHGNDLVPCVPPTAEPFEFRHVGCKLACSRGGRFDPNTLSPPQMEMPNTQPSAIIDLAATALRDLFEPSAPPFPSERTGVAALVATLNPVIRDHLTDGYLRALGAL